MRRYIGFSQTEKENDGLFKREFWILNKLKEFMIAHPEKIYYRIIYLTNSLVKIGNYIIESYPDNYTKLSYRKSTLICAIERDATNNNKPEMVGGLYADREVCQSLKELVNLAIKLLENRAFSGEGLEDKNSTEKFWEKAIGELEVTQSVDARSEPNEDWRPIETAIKDNVTDIEVRTPGFYPNFVRWNWNDNKWYLMGIGTPWVPLGYEPTEWRPISKAMKDWVEGQGEVS